MQGRHLVGPVELRFWEQVSRRGYDECWPWTGVADSYGYGKFVVRKGELEQDVTRQHRASRVAFRLVHGQWPDPQALHGCDNPPCCNAENPAHVHEGTQPQNMQEMADRGRARASGVPDSDEQLEEAADLVQSGSSIEWAARLGGCSESMLRRWCADRGIKEYSGLTMDKPVRTAVKRPGAGVTIDRERLVRMREIRLLSRAQLAEKMSGSPCPLCGMPYSHKPDCPNAGDFTITPDAIAKIENGYRRPKTVTLSRLCEALDCQPEDLLPPTEPAKRVACQHCGGLYAHEPGCPDAT